MSKIRIYGDTSGYVDLTAPAVADNSALSIGDIATSSDISTKPDYESGVWTPTFVSATGCFSGLTGIDSYSNTKYIKINNLVFFWGQILFSGAVTNSEGIVRISGLPYQSSFTNYSAGVAQLYGSHGGNDSEVMNVGVSVSITPAENIFIYRGTVNGTTAKTIHLSGSYLSI